MGDKFDCLVNFNLQIHNVLENIFIVFKKKIAQKKKIFLHLQPEQLLKSKNLERNKV